MQPNYVVFISVLVRYFYDTTVVTYTGFLINFDLYITILCNFFKSTLFASLEKPFDSSWSQIFFFVTEISPLVLEVGESFYQLLLQSYITDNFISAQLSWNQNSRGISF